MPLGRVSQRIADVVGQWEGVTILPHRFGGVEFRVQQRELGHLHNDRTADLPFTVRERRDLVAAGRARAHHMLANSGWVSLPIRSEHDIPAVLDLFRRNYERLRGAVPRMSPSSMGESIQLVEGRSIDELPA